MGLLGILLGLGLLIALAFRGWSVLLLAPLAAMLAGASRRWRIGPRPSCSALRTSWPSSSRSFCWELCSAS